MKTDWGRSMGLLCGWLLAGMLGSAAPAAGGEDPRPNVLWITAEDLSPHLGCYGDPDARTPNLDALAGQSVRYTRAFATAPVCSPARSCLITGMYATSLGTQRLRSQFPVPEQVRPFPAYLREAGYYCTNNVKTDYNLQNEADFIRDGWDESSPRAHWRGRREGQPFFAVFNFMTTHQSRTSVWPEEQFEREVASRLQKEQRHDPAGLHLPPYYPDTPAARRAWARYHDCIRVLDGEVGQLLADLEQDGLAEDTIVFFYGDHGMGTPRGKRCLHDAGMQVPLLIRFPPKWSRLAPAAAGSVAERPVSFVDFAPTVLGLCGVEPPAIMQGHAFLGPAAAPSRWFVYGARDRVDEAFDVARSVRDGRWLYIRNFMPHLSWMQPERFSDGSAFRRELKRLAAEGRLEPDQLTYAAPRRAVEELYDTLADPHQIHNLAGQPQHEEVLQAMRTVLRGWQLRTQDAGFLTEPQMWARLDDQTTPWDVARDPQRYPLEKLLALAEAVGDPGASGQLLRGLRDDHDAVRYWAAVGWHAAASLTPDGRAALEAVLQDSSPSVAIEAAAALARHGRTAVALPVLTAALEHPQGEVVLHAARTLELLGAEAEPARPAMRRALQAARRAEAGGDDIAMFIRFSLEAALGEP